MPNDPVSIPAGALPSGADYPVIPGYRLESVLGRGATGTVYRAVQLAVDREVAIKVLHPELGAKAVRRLQREARTTARLAHPGIVSAIDMGQVGATWWYAMELIDGPALSALLREKGRLKEREALRLFIPLCEALEHAHEHGVVHRDIKPANILVDGTGRARLVDLGLAFTEDDPQLTRTGGTLGTPHYLSPEQARNPQAVDVRSDIWSLGATMFHTMCGRPPFAGESVAEILSGVLYAQIPDPRELAPELSPGMALVLRKCLTRNADRRYTVPRELLRDLEALRERRAVAVSERSLDPVLGAAERHRRNLWIALAAVLVLATGGIFWWRPWAAPAVPGLASDGPPPSWAELDAILAASQGSDRRAPGQALLSLDELSSATPPEYSQAYYSALLSVQARFHGLVDDEQRRTRQAFDKALTQERDYVRAAELVSEEAENRIAREFGASEEQRKQVVVRLDFVAWREQVQQDEALALKTFGERVNEHYNLVVLPKVREAEAQGEWLDAHALVRREIELVLAEAGISRFGLSPDKVRAKLDDVRLYKVDSEVRRIELAWRAKDAELEKALVARAVAIESDLRGRALEGDASAALDAAFAEELASRSLAPAQMLVEVSRRSLAALERERSELSRLEQELLITDARNEFTAVEAELAPAWKDRQYPKLAAAWQKRFEEAWLEPVRPRIELRLQEAQLLEELLAKAAAGLSAPGLDAIRVGTILHPGRAEPGGDPLRFGFKWLIRGGKPELYAFRHPPADAAAKVLGTAGIEQLAGFAGDPRDDGSPVDRLVRAAFRLREGDAEAALKAFRSGPLPHDSHGQLIADLQGRLDMARGELDLVVQQREDAALVAYNLILRERSYTTDVPKRVKRITDLLTQYSDTAVVREHEAELRDLHTQILAPTKLTNVARLQAIYGPSIRFPGNDRALLSYTFSKEDLPNWEPGDWKRGLGGWTAERHSREDLDSETLWPRLILKEPLDLDDRMRVEIEFDQPQASGPPSRFVASVAGWHVGFAGPSEQGKRGQIAATAGGVSALRELLTQLDQRKGVETDGLERGGHYVLRVDLVQGRGKLSATLNGVVVLQRDDKRPEGKGGSYSIVVRSQEQVTLNAVRIEAGVKN